MNQFEPQSGIRCAEVDLRLLSVVNGRYGRIAYFARDVGAVSLALAAYGEWAANELAFMRQFIPKNGTVLDIGAYVGTHTLAFAGWTGEVVALEAQPATFQVLGDNVRCNGLTNVRLEHAAAGDYCGSMHAHGIDITTEASFGSASLAGAAPDTAGTMFDVPIVTIDSLDLPRCDFMKIDVEGMESAVIAGAAATIRRHRPVIYAECNSVELGADSLRVMRDLGYEVRLHVVDAFAEDNFFGNPVNIFGPAREAALVGVPLGDPRFETAVVQPCEIFARIETLDDLVLGLLNKPQYPPEILQPSAAAQSGGDAWLARFRDPVAGERQAAAEREAARRDSADLRAAAETMGRQATALEAREAALEGELRAVHDDLARADYDARLLHQELADQAAFAQAAVAQVALGQQAIKEASRGGAEAAGRNAALEAELAQAKAAFAAIEASTCWRMTGWLRTAVDRFRRWSFSTGRTVKG